VRAAIAGVVKKIELHTAADGLHRRLAVCLVHLIDGNRRLFAVISDKKTIESDGISGAIAGLTADLAAIGDHILARMKGDGEGTGWTFRDACAEACLVNSNLIGMTAA